MEKEKNVPYKIAIGMERISDAFKTLFWVQAKKVNLSPIQIQILIFLSLHDKKYANVSYLSKEYNVTKPTISQAIKTLLKKELISKEYIYNDYRKYTIFITQKGKKTLSELKRIGEPIQAFFELLPEKEQNYFFNILSQLIFQLNRTDVLQVQRICYACSYYFKKENTHHCGLLKKRLQIKEIRLDCSEFIPSSTTEKTL